MWTVLARGSALVVLVLAAASGAVGGNVPSPSPYYLGRGDPRACPSPICGGVWVHEVNSSSTLCGDDVARRECYVGRLDLSALAVPDETRTTLEGLVSGDRALARGTIVTGRIQGFPDLATLVVSEVWPASSSPRKPAGRFRLLRDNGVRCVTTPCFSISAALVNVGSRVNVSRVDLTHTGTTPSEQRHALLRIHTAGVIASGTIERRPSSGARRGGRTLVATQFFVRQRSG